MKRNTRIEICLEGSILKCAAHNYMDREFDYIFASKRNSFGAVRCFIVKWWADEFPPHLQIEHPLKRSFGEH